MASPIDWNSFTDTPLQADLMRRLSRLYQTTKLMRDGQRWTAPKIDWLAAQLGVHKSTVSRALKALSERGLILLKKWRWSRSPRLYIRVLIRSRNLKTQPQRNLTETQNATCYYNTGKEITPSGNTGGSAGSVEDEAVLPEISGRGPVPEKSPIPPSPLSPAKMTGDRRLGKKLGGTVEGAQKRAEKRKEAGGGDTPRNPHKASSRELARRWDTLLRAFDGNPVDTTDLKTLRHVGLVRDRMTARGLHPWNDLPTVIDRWTHYAPKNAGKTPYPWAVLRALDEFVKYRAAMETHAAPDPKPKPEPVPVHPSAPGPVHPKHAAKVGQGMKFKWSKKATPELNAPKDALSNGEPVIKGATTDETSEDDGE